MINSSLTRSTLTRSTLTLTVIFIIASKALAYTGQSDQMYDIWEKVTGTIEHVATVVAIIIGAFVAYYKFLRGRVFRPRLEPSVSAAIEHIEGINYLLVTLQLKNVGSSKVSFRRQSSGLNIQFDQAHRLPKNEADRLIVENIDWEEPVTIPVFEDHQWIESGETVQEVKIVALSIGSKIAVKLRLRIDTRRTTTVAMAIIRLTSSDDSILNVK